jgi:hypothetical protein
VEGPRKKGDPTVTLAASLPAVPVSTASCCCGLVVLARSTPGIAEFFSLWTQAKPMFEANNEQEVLNLLAKSPADEEAGQERAGKKPRREFCDKTFRQWGG